uniref:NADH dehydrogenase subunit 6 n=1 Tax=Encarsia obtusiclava TaxID=2358487 RepID=A0A386T938_9HYME|nr:NADH dehydrogenase subunit 6 [Encarsia obtusiclava]
MTKFYLNLFMYLINLMLIMSLIINSMTLNNKFTHPTFMGCMLIMFSMILSLNLSMYFQNHWFSYIMFLTIISGMMILFMYFISFINNMKMLFKMSSYFNMILINTILMTTFSIMMYFMNKNFMWFNFNEIKSIYYLMIKNLMNNYMKINFFYNYNKNFSTMISMIYLFFCLTMIVKICMMNKYSLRKIN